MPPSTIRIQKKNTLLLLLALLFSFGFHFLVVFDKRLVTPLGSEVEFQGRLGPRCFLAALRAVNSTSLLTSRVPSYRHVGASLSQLSLPPECARRLQPLFVDLGEKNAVMKCLLKRKLNVSASEQAQLFRTLKNLRDAFQEAKLELLLDSGTLLGSLRHHGRIAYDDDFDFRVRHDQKKQVRALLLAFPKSKFRDTEASAGHWKLNILCNDKLERCRFQVDFFFWWKGQHSLQFPEYPFNLLSETVYPLSKRPFEGILFDSPRKPLRTIQATYDIPSVMECRTFDHTPLRRNLCPGRMDCAMLEPFVPFVRKIIDDRFGSLELLLQSSRLLRVFFLPNGH